MERDFISIVNWGVSAISTHTLTWSVTKARLDRNTDTVISTHTLTWSVTNPSITQILLNVISTHTLTWSVTKVTSDYMLHFVFQLTRSRGA